MTRLLFQVTFYNDPYLIFILCMLGACCMLSVDPTSSWCENNPVLNRRNPLSVIGRLNFRCPFEVTIVLGPAKTIAQLHTNTMTDED